MTTLLLPPDEIAKLRVLKGLAYMLAVMITLDRHYPGRAFRPEQVAVVAGMDARTASKQLQDLSTLDRVILSNSGYVLTQGGRALFLASSTEALALSPVITTAGTDIHAQALNTQSLHIAVPSSNTHSVRALKKIEEDSSLILKPDSSSSDSQSTHPAHNPLRNPIASTLNSLKPGESAAVPDVTGYTFEDGSPVYQMECADGSFITTRDILDATEAIEDFGDLATGLPVDAIKPELALAWIAKAYDDRTRLHRPPAALVYVRLHDIEQPRPHQKYFKDPARYLPDAYIERLKLKEYDCKSCVDQKFATHAALEEHIRQAHSVILEEQPILPINSSLHSEDPGRKAWESVKIQLQSEMPRASFETWVRDTQALQLDEDVLTIGARNAYCRDWLDSRLISTVEGLLSGILNKKIKVCFIVAISEDESDD